MGSDWDEIKRLAADFQEAQLSSTLQKLSERNCVEIVSLLLQKEFVDVVFTNDGKEYITPDHLKKEVLDELYVNGGRVNLVEISKSLNVDLSKVEDLASQIKCGNQQIHLMLGQLIEEEYVIQIAQEINEKLLQKGEISVSDLTVQFDLPSEFLQQNVLEKYIGKIIRGRQDTSNPRVFFTQAYIQRCKSKIKGALAAITRPTTVAAILQQIDVQEKLFHTLLDEIAPLGTVTTKLSNAHYVPHIYAKMQSNWLTALYKQSGFLEYESITKLGISDPKLFIKKNFPDVDMLFLKRCAVGSEIIDLTIISALNECNAAKSFVDLSSILPSNMSEEDIEEIFQSILASRSIPNNFVFLETVVFSNHFLTNILKPCNDSAMEVAKTAVESGLYQQFLAEKHLMFSGKNDTRESHDESKTDKRDERRKKASSGKGGGGTQGRETKTKSTKKYQRGGNFRGSVDNDDEDNIPLNKKSNKTLELVTKEQIEHIVGKILEEEGIERLSGVIAALYQKEINQTALEAAQKLFEASPQTNRRQNHAQLQEKLNTLIADIRLYEKGLKLFPVDVQSQMIKYLIKSLGNDICNELTIYLANECNLNVKSTNNYNIDQRNKIAEECDPEYKTALIELNKAMNKTIDEFIIATEVALRVCGMSVKKIDKKKDRALIIQHKEKLCEQLVATEDHALVLHLTALILFITVTGCILHASGRFVSHILSLIRPNMSSQQNELLMQFHDLVLKLLQNEAVTDEYNIAIEQLNSLKMAIKDLAILYEKPGVSKTD